MSLLRLPMRAGRAGGHRHVTVRFQTAPCRPRGSRRRAELANEGMQNMGLLPAGAVIAVDVPSEIDFRFSPLKIFSRWPPCQRVSKSNRMPAGAPFLLAESAPCRWYAILPEVKAPPENSIAFGEWRRDEVPASSTHFNAPA